MYYHNVTFLISWSGYCKSGNFHENFIFADSIKRHICDFKNWRIGHDVPILVNDRVISPFREDSIFIKLRENKILAKISEFTVFQNFFMKYFMHHRKAKVFKCNILGVIRKFAENSCHFYIVSTIELK